MWTKISEEQARRHPLFGVKGFLLLVGCLMILLLLVSPLLQVISKQMAGYTNPRFVPGVAFVALVIVTWGVFRRKSYVRIYAYCLGGLTIIGGIFLLYWGDAPYLPYLAEDALLTLLVRDVPLCAYFTWSRRARVTLECRVRPDDPLLVAGETPAHQKDARHAGAATPLSGSAGARASSGNGIGQAAHRQNAADRSAKAETDAARRFELLLQYAPAVRDAYAAIGHLPDDLKRRFKTAVLEQDGHLQAEALRDQLLAEHEKRTRPFASAEANDLLERARAMGPAAEKEFREVMALLGPSAPSGEIFRNIYAKYGLEWIVADLQRMLTFLADKDFRIRAGTGRSVYHITDPVTCKTTIQTDFTIQAFCRRVWERQTQASNA